MRCLYQSNAPNVGDSRVPGHMPGGFPSVTRSAYMRDVKRWLSVAAFGVSVGLTGCVSSSKYKKVQAERNQLRQEIQSARAEAEDYRNQLGAVSEAVQGKDEKITSLSSEKSELQAQLDQINQQYAQALAPALTTPAAALSHVLS